MTSRAGPDERASASRRGRKRAEREGQATARRASVVEFSSDGESWVNCSAAKQPWPRCDGRPSASLAGQPVFSDEDADLRRRKWVIGPEGYARTLFAGRHHRKKQDPHGRVAYGAHQLVMERVLGRELLAGEVVDHINFDPLDCRRSNLRVTDARGNAQHRRERHDSGTGARNVFVRHDRRGQYVVAFRQGPKRYFGQFETLDEAREAAARARRELGFLGSNDDERKTS